MYTLGNQNSPTPGSPVTVLSSRTAFPLSSTKLVPLKRRRSSPENDLTSPRASKMNYFVASATVVSVPAATQPLFENVRHSLRCSIEDSCQALFRPTESGPPIACPEPIDASRLEYNSDSPNCRLPMEQTSDWSFMPTLPSFLRPLPPLDAIGTLDPLPVLLDRSLLKPLPPVAGVGASGGRLDQLFDNPAPDRPVALHVSPALHTEETPLAQLLTTMQEYNQEVVEFKDASTMAKNAKKRLDQPQKQDNPLKTRGGKQAQELDGDDRLNINIPWSVRNSKSRKKARLFVNRLARRKYAHKMLSNAAQLAVRTGKWRRNTSRRLDMRAPQERRSVDPLIPTGDSRNERNVPPPKSPGSSPMSVCSVLDRPVSSAAESSLDLPNIHTTDRAQSPSNDAFSISSTPQSIPVELPSGDYPVYGSKLPDLQTAGEAVIANSAGVGDRSKSPDFQKAFEDAWNATMANSGGTSTPPHQLCSPLSPQGSCSPIPGLAQSSWDIVPEEKAENQNRPSWATPLKRKAPPSPTWSPPPDSNRYIPDRSSKSPDADIGISLKGPSHHLSVIPVSGYARVTPNLRLRLSPKPTITRPLYSRHSGDVALPTPIDDNEEEQIPPITPLDSLELVGSNAASDTNSLFDGDLSEDEGSVVADPRPSRRRRPRTPSPISTRAITFTRTPESRQLPTPSSLSPQPSPRFPIRLPSIRSIAPMYLSNEVQSMLYDLEADAQEPSSAKNLLKTQLWREKKAGGAGELGGRIQLNRMPVALVSTAAVDAVTNNALVALSLRDAMAEKDNDRMFL